jgi:hypothetical protein
MSRVWDYFGFAVWFAGLGYIVLWLCGSVAQLGSLSPLMHVIGVAAAISVPIRLAFGIGERRGANAAFAARASERRRGKSRCAAFRR